MTVSSSSGDRDRIRVLAAVPRPDGTTLLASAGHGRVVRLWDPATGNTRPIAELTGHGVGVRALAALPERDGRNLLASSGYDRIVRLWDPATSSEPVAELTGHTGPVWALAALPEPDGRTLLAAGGDDRVMRLWDPATSSEPVAELTGHGVEVRALAALPEPDDGRTLLASAGDDKIVRLWDPATGNTRPIAELTGHTGPVWALAAVPGPDGRALLASAGYDKIVRLWDPATSSEPVAELTGHTDIVSALAAVPGPDGRALLASAGDDRVLRLWWLAMDRAVRFRGAGDGPAVSDLLGRKALVDVLAELVARREDGGGKRPAVVSVEGRWGSGKTSVLTQLQDALNGVDNPAAGPATVSSTAPAPGAAEEQVPAARRRWRSGRLTVRAASRALATGQAPRTSSDARQRASKRAVAWFNPWAHQSADQVWAGLTEAIHQAAGPAVYGTGTNGRQRYWFAQNLRRVDRRELHRLLWKRVRSPLLAISVVAALVPLVTALGTRTNSASVLGRPVPAALLAAAIPALLLLVGLGHTATRYFFGRASQFLPAMLFERPVLSGVLAQADTARDAGVQDPLYRSRSGYLYLVQHDVKALLTDLEEAGGDLVVFIDDLDRCTPATTAQVLEAINLFLSEHFPRAQFVLGLDPEVVAAHIDRTYSDLLTAPGVRPPSVTLPGDRSPGWTFLRKLIQLPVMLPSVDDSGVERLLDDILSPVDPTVPTTQAHQREQPAVLAAPAPPARPGDRTPDEILGDLKDLAGSVHRDADQLERLRIEADRPADPDPAAARTDPLPVAADPDALPQPPAPDDAGSHRITGLMAALERHPAVRQRLQDRLVRQPDRSVREAKRLLTVWQFYVRLLDRIDPAPDEASLIERARTLVIVAEIITRWPAQQAAFRTRHDPDTIAAPTSESGDVATGHRGLHLLAAAATGDRQSWHDTVKTVLPGPDQPDADLRDLLRDYDGVAVADLYARLT